MIDEQLGTGAEASITDPRTVQYDMALSNQLKRGGVSYSKSEIDHQHLVGICTAISRTQLRQKQTGRKYSPEFQYILQKRFYDSGWFEGSSILHAQKVAKRFGFLPAELWTHTTEADRYLPYKEYSKKLQSIPTAEIDRLIKLCVDPILGYAEVDVSDPQKVAKAIVDSPVQAGILCRYDCGYTWWTPSWKERDISPLKKPVPATSGHAIIMNKFDYSKAPMQELTNTWGTTWARNGAIDINWSDYRMTEAWVDLLNTPIIRYVFTKTLRLNSRGTEVKELQLRLNSMGYKCGVADGIFGQKTLQAVKAYQKTYGLTPDGIVGINTNSHLNS